MDGALTEYVLWPDDFVYRVPGSVSDDAAALLEPLAVGLWAARRGDVRPGHSVAVLGAGPVGCTTVMAARAAGATTIIAVDLEDFRLDLAREVGATHTLNARSGTRWPPSASCAPRATGCHCRTRAWTSPSRPPGVSPPRA